MKIVNNDTYSRRKFECCTDKIAFGIFSPDDKLTFVTNGGVYHEMNQLTSSSTVESSLFLIDDDSSSSNKNYKECIDHFYCACRSTHS